MTVCEHFLGSDVGRIPRCPGITGWHQLTQSTSSQTALLLQEITCGMSSNLSPYDTSVLGEPDDAGEVKIRVQLVQLLCARAHVLQSL